MEHERDAHLQDGSSQAAEVASEFHLEFELSQASAISSFERWIDDTPMTQVRRVARPPSLHEQGAVDILAAVASSSSIVALIRILPEFIRSRRSNVNVTIRVGDREATIGIENVKDAPAIIASLLEK
jgi:hypothetical protein